MMRLTKSGDARDVDPVYSPDGTKIVFASDRTGTVGAPDVYIGNPDGSTLSASPPA